MGMFTAGVAGVGVFYIIILGVSVWTGASKRKKIRGKSLDDLILANRGLGTIMGILTLVATWIGGVFVHGTAESIYSKGLIWCQVPIGYSLSLLFGAFMFVKPMRKAEYVTMLDPFQQRYGARLGGLLFIPALVGDVFWTAALLKALSNTLSIVGGISNHHSVFASHLLVTIYIMFGGLYSPVSADVLQVICITIGLGIATPFAILNPAVSIDKNIGKKDWLGEIETRDYIEWIDGMLLLIFGGITFQGYFQRVLSIKNTTIAKTCSVIAMIYCLIISIPTGLMGLVARGTDWSIVEGFNRTFTSPTINDASILPIVLKSLTPQWIAFIGLGVISVTVMSSANSSVFGSSSMFTRNIYRMAIRPKATDKELSWILMITILLITFMATGIALTTRSVYYLSFLSSDLTYVVLFPQLLAVIHWPSYIDTYGCLAGYIVSLFLRLTAGEKYIGLPVFIQYPYFDHKNQIQKFPFRTTAMLSAIVTQLIVSFITRNIFGGKTCCPRCCDFLGIYASGKSKEQNRVAQSSSGAALLCLNEGSAGRDSTDSQEDDRPSCEDSQNSEETMNYGNFTDRRDFTLRRGMSVQNTPVTKINRNYQKNQTQTPGRNRIPNTNLNNLDGQILGVRNLPINTTTNHHHITNDITANTIRLTNTNTMINNALQMSSSSSSTNHTYGKLNNIEKAKEIERSGDRSTLELNLNLNLNQDISIGHVKKNLVGVKLVGMDGVTTLRRPSQGTFSPTPSVEMVHIMDRRQSGGSFGPASLSPVPGVEACKIHGTAVGGSGNDHCRIKRGIVRHHSFNDTGDRTLTTLARQPAYPSMPIRTDDCKMTIKRDKKLNGTIARHSSVADDKNHCGRGLLLSPTYNVFNPSNFFVCDDEAVSRF